MNSARMLLLAAVILLLQECQVGERASTAEAGMAWFFCWRYSRCAGEGLSPWIFMAERKPLCMMVSVMKSGFLF